MGTIRISLYIMACMEYGWKGEERILRESKKNKRGSGYTIILY
jgi:hypothetical protein